MDLFVYSQGGAIVQIVYNPALAVREHRAEGSSGHKKVWGELENFSLERGVSSDSLASLF